MTRRIWIPLVLSLGVLAAGAGGLWALWRTARPALHEKIIAEARARGFELELEGFSLSRERVVLVGATVRPLGVRGLVARLDTVTLELSGLGWSVLWGGAQDVTLTGLEVDGADVHLLGSAPALALELSRWSEHYPSAYDLPARASQVALAWRVAAERAPWLLVTGGEVARQTHGGTFEAAAASVLDRRVGPVGSSWSKRDGRILLGFGEPDPATAPVQLELLLDAPEPVARVELRRTALDTLTGALGITLPLADGARERIEVEAKGELLLPPSLAPASVGGALEVNLLGFVPPHPPELQGIVSGDRTTFTTRFEVSADQATVQLTDAKVAAGAFVLEGDGVVRRAEDHAQVHLRFAESLPCVKLANAAADTRLGKHWAGLTKQLLQKYMQGSVTVQVRVDADTRDLGAAKVTQSIGVGCGLQPLRPPTAEELAALSAQLPGLIAELPQLPPGLIPVGAAGGELRLPPLPSNLPPLPTVLPALPPALTPPPLPRLPGSSSRAPGSSHLQDPADKAGAGKTEARGAGTTKPEGGKAPAEPGAVSPATTE